MGPSLRKQHCFISVCCPIPSACWHIGCPLLFVPDQAMCCRQSNGVGSDVACARRQAARQLAADRHGIVTDILNQVLYKNSCLGPPHFSSLHVNQQLRKHNSSYAENVRIVPQAGIVRPGSSQYGGRCSKFLLGWPQVLVSASCAPTPILPCFHMHYLGTDMTVTSLQEL